MAFAEGLNLLHKYYFFGLIIGYIIQLAEQRVIIRLPISLKEFRKLLQKAALLFFIPISSIGVIWIIKIEDIRLALLPFLAISVIKYILIPLIVSVTSFLLGYGEIEEGLPLKVVIILSSLPVAFTALSPPSIYDLDLDLANSCWLITTLSIVLILPLLSFIISLI